MTTINTASKPGIPVPLVPSPPISAPPSARDPRTFMPAHPEQEGVLEDVMDGLPHAVPNWLAEAVFTASRDINHHLFKSGPPNPPLPETPGSWKFAVIGDYGGGRPPLTDVTNNIARRNPDIVLTVGDNVYYNGTEQEYQKQWDPPQYFGDIRKNFPVMPALGNHDTNVSTEPYFKRFPELDGARYYSFEEKGAHFVALNSNESMAPDSPQYKWLEQDLAASKDDWKVLYFHHPMYSGFPKPASPNAGYLAPLIAKYGVDLVLTGHEHNYSRSKPLNDGGTIEVITGGGGHTLHPFISKVPSWNAYRDVDFGHVEVEVRPDELVGRYVVRDGSVRDTFVIPNLTPGGGPFLAKTGADHVQPPATPASPVEAAAATAAAPAPPAAAPVTTAAGAPALITAPAGA